MTDRLFAVVLGMLFALVYTQGYMEQFGVPRGVVKAVAEFPVLLILLHLVNRGLHQLPPGLALIGLYVVWTGAAAIFHGDGVLGAILYSRYVLYAYIVFAAAWCTPMTQTAITRINTTIAGLFLFQIGASACEVFVRGERVEAHVGALFADGGALATEFPLFAMALAIPLFLFGGHLLYLVISWGFFLVGYASGKRAIYFLGPGLYFFTFAWYAIRGHAPSAFRKSVVGVLVFLCLIPVILFGMSRSHGIGQEYARSFAQQVAYAFEAATDYTMAEKQLGQTTGRTSTSRRVLATLWEEDEETVLFGWGPSSVRVGQEDRYGRLMITYGICGWAQDVICIGWPGMLIYVVFLLRMFLSLQSYGLSQYSGRWRALRFGVEIAFFVVLLSYIGYSSSVITGGQLSYVYFYLLALLMSPQHRPIVGSTS